MASSAQMMRYLCSAVKEYKILFCTGRGIHVSSVLAKKVDKNPFTSNASDKSEKDELIDAAANVAASMTGIEDEAFLDITDQLSKLESTAQQRQSMQTSMDTQQLLGKIPQVDEKTKSRLESAKQRFVEAVAAGKGKQFSTKLTEKTNSQAEEKPAQPEPAAEVKDISKAQAQVMSRRRDETLSLLDEALSFADQRRKIAGGGRQERGTRARGRNEPRDEGKSAGAGQTDGRYRQTGDRRSRISTDGSIAGNDPLHKVKPLNIFNPSKWASANEAETVPMLSSWLEEEELKVRRTQVYPSNGFDEMARLTEEGKLWKYPIDNEQGMEEELNTPFYEHVFLDKHLTPFPSSGPVRRFMELVTLGLSKNPHLSVKEKVAHIKWFEEYFREKQSYVTAEKLLADSAV